MALRRCRIRNNDTASAAIERLDGKFGKSIYSAVILGLENFTDDTLHPNNNLDSDFLTDTCIRASLEIQRA